MISFLKKPWAKLVVWLSELQWAAKSSISDEECQRIKELLSRDYYIILTRRSNHFSTYMISIADFFLTGKLGYWSHVLMNLEDEVKTDDDYILIEAIGSGVTKSHFSQVFDVDSVAIIKPKNITVDQWTAILDKAKDNLGKPYDNLFDLKNDREINCVELVRNALMATKGYHENFANFEKMISEKKNLTPNMFYTCSDFEIVFESRVGKTR